MWRDEPPPPKSNSGIDWAEVAAELRTQPMKWTMVAYACRTSVYVAVHQNRVKAVRRDRGFEVMSRNNQRFWGDDGKEIRTCDLWMRYNPANVSPIAEAVTKRKEG